MDCDIARVSAAEIARGLIAGLAGTAAMSLSQKAEMALTGRKPSATPAEALCLLLGFETRTEAEEQRLAEEAHWAYGTIWGLGHSLTRPIPEPARSLVYLAAVWGAGTTLLTATRLSPPPTQWTTESLLSDIAHHAVYAGVGGLAYRALGALADGSRSRDEPEWPRLPETRSAARRLPSRSADSLVSL